MTEGRGRVDSGPAGVEPGGLISRVVEGPWRPTPAQRFMAEHPDALGLMAVVASWGLVVMGFIAGLGAGWFLWG